MNEKPDDDFVTHSDYKEVLDERDNLRKLITLIGKTRRSVSDCDNALNNADGDVDVALKSLTCNLVGSNKQRELQLRGLVDYD